MSNDYIHCRYCEFFVWWQKGNYFGEADDMRAHVKREHSDVAQKWEMEDEYISGTGDNPPAE